MQRESRKKVLSCRYSFRHDVAKMDEPATRQGQPRRGARAGGEGGLLVCLPITYYTMSRRQGEASKARQKRGKARQPQNQPLGQPSTTNSQNAEHQVTPNYVGRLVPGQHRAMNRHEQRKPRCVECCTHVPVKGSTTLFACHERIPHVILCAILEPPSCPSTGHSHASTPFALSLECKIITNRGGEPSRTGSVVW